MNPERIRAAIRMLYPDEMTPTARNVLENILDDEELEAVADAAASSMTKGENVTTSPRNDEQLKAAAWDAGCAAGYQWALIEDPNMAPEEEATRPRNPYTTSFEHVTSGHPQYARLKVVDGDTTSFPIGERGRGGWHSGVMFYPDSLVESYTPLTVFASGPA